ncbi:MAG: hypothetical protein PW734_01445 [Verrucomicrobium sp.]|nr:hypothetical protein [Verrucomicrobium sp.]
MGLSRPLSYDVDPNRSLSAHLQSEEDQKEWEFTGLTFKKIKKALDDLKNGKGRLLTVFDRTDHELYKFAFTSLVKEFHIRGENLSQWNFSTSFRRWFTVRFYEWAFAANNYLSLLKRKGCPEHDHPDEGMALASRMGWLAANYAMRSDPRIWEFIQNATPKQYKVFRSKALDPQPARWAHPELDAWLTLIAPIIEEYNWNCDQLQRVAAEKFDKTGYPYDRAEDMGIHCRKILRLQLVAAPRGRKNLNAKLPRMAKLALQIDPQGFMHSFFADIKEMKARRQLPK